MGSEKKSRKRRSSPSSSSQDDKKRSRKHSKRDEERKPRKDEVKERKRKRDHKSHQHSEKKRKGKHTDSKKLSDSGFKELTDEDYFSRNHEFSTWLKEERGVYFSDLSSEAARGLFSKFIKAWNRHKLQPQYYDGIAGAPRTAHNWKIKH